MDSSEGVGGGARTMKEGVCLIGYGYWGKNLARCFNELGVLRWIIDESPQRLMAANKEYPKVPVATDLQFIAGEKLDSVAIATPPKTHYQVAKLALMRGLHVFVEKPMTTSYEQALELSKLAEERRLSLMVGHIYLHNDGVKAIPIPVGKAELYVQLLNDKGSPSESTRDVVWAGLPHACSLALHFFPDEPEVVEARRGGDRIRVTLTYWNGSEAYLDVGDNTGRRLRKVELREGDTRYLFDANYPSGIVVRGGSTEILHGDLSAAKYTKEPLMEECKAFLEYEGVDHLGPKVVKLIEEILIKCP